MTERGATAARVLAIAAWLAIAAGAFQPFYLQIFTFDGGKLREAWTELPYRKVPGLRTAMIEVAKRTPGRAHILFWTPHRSWEGGYNYAYRRAQYLLAGREVVSLLEDGRDAVDPSSIQRANFIACVPDCPGVPPGFEVEWRGTQGMLLRRLR